MVSIYQLLDYHDDDRIYDFEYEPEIHKVVTPSTQMKLLIPKFIYKRNISFGLDLHDLLMSREKLERNMEHVDRWYIYLLLDILQKGRTSEALNVAYVSLLQISNSGKKLQINSLTEFPDLRNILNACNGDFILVNDNLDDDVFVTSKYLPYTLLNLLDFNPFGVASVRELIDVQDELSPTTDTLTWIFSFLGVNEELVDEEKQLLRWTDDTYDNFWPEYETVKESEEAYKARNGRKPEHKFKKVNLEKLDKVYQELEAKLSAEVIESKELFKIIEKYYSIINRVERYLFIANSKKYISKLVNNVEL